MDQEEENGDDKEESALCGNLRLKEPQHGHSACDGWPDPSEATSLLHGLADETFGHSHGQDSRTAG